MNFLASPRVLRTVLWADAGSCAASALLLLAGGGPLAPLLGLAPALLLAAGLALVPFALGAAWLARQPVPPRGGVLTLALANGAWVLGCVALLAGGAAGTALGQAFLLLQALAVGLLAELQWFAGRAAVARPA